MLKYNSIQINVACTKTVKPDYAHQRHSTSTLEKPDTYANAMDFGSESEVTAGYGAVGDQ
jgi:hypothetical protein